MNSTLFLQIQYSFEPGCKLAMDVQVDSTKFMPDMLQGELNSLPRIGLEITVPEAMQRCIWYGWYAIHCLCKSLVYVQKVCAKVGHLGFVEVSFVFPNSHRKATSIVTVDKPQFHPKVWSSNSMYSAIRRYYTCKTAFVCSTSWVLSTLSGATFPKHLIRPFPQVSEPNCSGPHENYVDRCSSAPARVYSAAVPHLHTPYIAPSECGGREAARWLALTAVGCNDTALADDTPRPELQPRVLSLLVAHRPPPEADSAEPWGVRAVKTSERPGVYMPAKGLHFTVSQYSVGQLLTARHEHELEGGPCRLHIDGFHMGLGGDDSWTPSVRHRQLT
jgi:hypothetical protein